MALKFPVIVIKLLPEDPISAEPVVKFTVPAVTTPLDSRIPPEPLVAKLIVPFPETRLPANVILPFDIVANEKVSLLPAEEFPNVILPVLVTNTFPVVFAVKLDAAVRILLPLLPISMADTRFTFVAVKVPLNSFNAPVPLVVKSIVPMVPEVAARLATARLIEPFPVVAKENVSPFPTEEAPNVTLPVLLIYTLPAVLAVRFPVVVRILFPLVPISAFPDERLMVLAASIPVDSIIVPDPPAASVSVPNVPPAPAVFPATVMLPFEVVVTEKVSPLPAEEPASEKLPLLLT